MLNHPAVQAGAVPFVAALLTALALGWARLSGLAALAGFAAAVWLIGNFALEPLTATRKMVVLGAAAAAAGLFADLAFKPTRATAPALGALFGLLSLWVFWTVLQQKPPAAGLLAGIATLVFSGWTVALGATLQADPIRAGALGLALGVGAGVSAVLSASALLGQYGIALGAASGGFLLAAVLLARSVAAGASFVLVVSVLGALVAAGALHLAQLPWAALVALALVPLAVKMPLPRAAPWLQAACAAAYALIPAAAACALAWHATRG